jgi:gluconolactonase
MKRQVVEIAEVAAGLQFPEGPIAMPDGSFIVVEIAAGRLSRISADGKVESISTLGGSPNGAAIGPDGMCYVCNSGGFEWHQHPLYGLRGGLQPNDYSGGRIERVNLRTGHAERLYDSSPQGPLQGPNDLVFDRAGGFWFTDSGKVRANDRDHGAVYYASPQGNSIRRVIYPFIHPHPNGIGLSPDESTLYVSETATGRVWAFDIPSPGNVALRPFPSPHGGTLVAGLPGYQLLVSMAIDSAGNICVATMMNGGVTVISPSGDAIEHLPLPDILPTNLCFGDRNLSTAYVTLSGSGRLIALKWPRPGLRLNFT